ncbi:MAG: hypothetical protein ACLPLR_14915 [Terriglobales bacterium]
MRTWIAILLMSVCGRGGLAQGGADHSQAPAPAATASANVPVPASSVSPEPNSPVALALAAAKEAAKELEAVDVPKYCFDLAGNQGHSSSLAAVCEFALNLRKKLSNVICDRETKRYWTTGRPAAFAGQGGRGGRGGRAIRTETDDVQHADVVTVNVTYRDGQEYYHDVRVDGQPAPVNSPELSGSWSHGEFATMLEGVFAPSSKAQFHYSKETKLHSIQALVFDFKVASQNNRLYFLKSGDKIWFPEYEGRIWVDAHTSSLLRLERETAYMRDDPVTRTKTEIEYSNLVLGDGTSMVLPTNSKVLICEPPLHGNSDNCARIIITFKNWHKFRAQTRILSTEEPH